MCVSLHVSLVHRLAGASVCVCVCVIPYTQAEEYKTRADTATKEAAAAKQELKAKKAERTKCDDALRQNQ